MRYIFLFLRWGWLGYLLWYHAGVVGWGPTEDFLSPLIQRHFLYLGQTLTFPLPFIPREIIVHPTASVKPHWHTETQSLRLVSKKQGTTSLQLLTPDHHWVTFDVTVLSEHFQSLALFLEQLSLRGAQLSIQKNDQKSKSEIILTGTVMLIEDWCLLQKRMNGFGSEILNRVILHPTLVNLLIDKVTRDLQQQFGYTLELRPLSEAISVEGEIPSEADKSQLLVFLKDFFPHIVTDRLWINVSNTDQVNLGLQFIEVDQDSALALGIDHNGGQFQWSIPQNAISFTSHLSLLLSNGKAKVLSKPNLVARHHQTAELHIGGQIPYEVKTYSRLSVQWKSYGIELKITPHPLKQHHYHLVFALTVSFPLSGGQNQQGLPTFTRRAITSEVIIEQDHTAVLSGLVQQLEDLNQSGLPLLGNLPILGHLFKHTGQHHKATELIITITPRAYRDYNLQMLQTQQPKLENHSMSVTP